ncbi:MAG: polyhydroxybutyrate depolymerase [Pseudomonadota bacterium]
MIRAILAAALLAPTPALAVCGTDAGACTIETGEYHVVLPRGWEGGRAVVFLHGFGGSGAREAQNEWLVGGVTARGHAFVAPSGVPWREAEPNPPDWAVRDTWTYPRDDVAFIRAVIDDAAERFAIRRGEVLLTGFSRGGSMTWDIACIAPDTAYAYAPASGGFWRPHPEDCAGPVRLLHGHGFADRTVPLEGRRILWEELDVTQGDIHEGLQLWRRVNGCGSRAGEHAISAETWTKVWTDCAEGAALALVLHPGGHGLPPGWMGTAIDWFEALLDGPT